MIEHFELRVLTEPAEFERCDEFFVEHHYLHSANREMNLTAHPHPRRLYELPWLHGLLLKYALSG